MASRPKPLGWTYAEFARLPDDGNRYEVIAGELYVTPAPRTAHQDAVSELNMRLRSFVQQHDLGKVLNGPVDVLFGEGDYLVPDLVFVRRDRQKKIVQDRGIEAAPDLVVEVVSRSTAKRDRGIKRERYAHFGVPEYWVVDVEAERVEVYRPGADPHIETETLTWRPVEGGPVLEIVLKEFFAVLQ